MSQVYFKQDMAQICKNLIKNTPFCLFVLLAMPNILHFTSVIFFYIFPSAYICFKKLCLQSFAARVQADIQIFDLMCIVYTLFAIHTGYNRISVRISANHLGVNSLSSMGNTKLLLEPYHTRVAYTGAMIIDRKTLS